MILITTSGKVGAEAARVLAEQGDRVRVLVRDPAKTPTSALAGAQVVAGDLSDRSTIDRAMSDVDRVVLVSPAVREQEFDVVASAVAAGVRHIVKIGSEASAASPISRRRDQAAIENAVTSSGLDFTLLRNNAYMQNFLMLAPAIAESSHVDASAGDGRIGMVDTRDVAAVAAAIVSAPAPHRGRTYHLSGPSSLSYEDAAAVLASVLDRPVTYRPLTFGEQKHAMTDLGVPETIAEMNALALALFDAGDSDWVTTDVPDVLGRPAIDFARFVADHRAAFAGDAS